MNVVGDRAFNMYLNSENEKLSRPPLNRDQIALAIMRKVSFFNSYKCFCSGFNSETTSPLFEEKHVTEILMSSLNISVAEHILSLTQNYTVEELALSELSLKAFFAFVANTPKFAAEKARILTALNEQLRLHPSCSSYMVSRYRDLMLLRDEEFAGLSLLEFVVTKLEQLVSVNNDVQISSTRSSRRRRRPTRMVDESPIKRPKRVEVFVDSDEDETNGSEADPSSKGQHPDVENLLRLLEHLVNILRHDVGYMLKCGEKVHTCILGQLMFGADGMPNQSFVTRICEVLKNAETLPVLRGISELLDLVGDVCALQQTDSDPNGGYDVELPGPCRSLINEICATVIGEKPSPAKAFSVVVNLGPAWLRYYTIRYLIEKIFCRKVPFGLKGVVSVFNSIHRNIRERVMDTTKVLKLVNHNQLAYAGNAVADGKKFGKSELNSYETHEAVGKHSSAKSEMKSEIHDEEIEEKNIDFSVRQKLTPSMCDLLIVFIDSTITIVTLAGATDSFKTTEDSENLKNTLNELCGEKNIPVELNLLRRRLNKIL